MYRIVSRALFLLLGTVLFGACDEDTTSPEEGPPSLETIEQETQQFQDIEAAENAGYMNPGEECAAHPTEGAMGVHLVHPQLLGLTDPVDGRVHGTDPEIDFTRPEILVYEPQADGSMELVALEYLVFAEAWDANNDSPPSYDDHEFHYMEDDPSTEPDEAHGFTAHYDLHMWLFRDNPNGTFAEWNPDVTCEHFTPSEG